jgi:hypothetical protein
MLSSVSRQQRLAAHGLSQHTWWSALNNMLTQELAMIYELMTTTQNPVALHQLQGRAQALRELQACVNEAGEIIRTHDTLHT